MTAEAKVELDALFEIVYKRLEMYGMRVTMHAQRAGGITLDERSVDRVLFL